MQHMPSGAKGLATPILEEPQEMPNANAVVIIPTMKCLAHADAVDGSKQVSPAGVLDCSNVMGIDAG